MIPYLVLIGSVGVVQAYERLISRSSCRQWVLPAFVATGIVIWSLQIIMFFNGPYKIPFRSDILTQLQLDLDHSPEVPFLFSDRIPDVDHFHFPGLFCYFNYLFLESNLSLDVYFTDTADQLIG